MNFSLTLSLIHIYPSTTNLIALAKLFGIEPEELLRAAEVKDESETEG